MPLHKYTYTNGYRAPAPDSPVTEETSGEKPSYVYPEPALKPTSLKPNEKGILKDPTFPSLLAGTSAPGVLPSWFKKDSEVDVVICGAGPSGLEVAVSLLRQGVSFRIVDKAAAPLLAGRADGVQPRFLETIGTWGLATEVAEEGPLIERTAIWKDGRCLHWGHSHQSDSRYRGLHIITQTAIEHIYIRDLLRHKKLVERRTTVKSFTVDESGDDSHPVSVTLINEDTGEQEVVRAKHLVGSDGGNSTIRKQAGIPFEGETTDIHWGILDAVFETDYPHANVFGFVMNSEHGGCCIIPREDGMIRLYTEISSAKNKTLVNKKGGRLNITNVTPEEILEQANKIFHPFKLKFGSPLSWFTVWNISERVAQQFSYKDRVHLVGDACHVHSVLGAFGLNASILDAANLGWKLGWTIKGLASPEKLIHTYGEERRRHAVRIIEVSGTYLRFVSESGIDVSKLQGIGTEKREDQEADDGLVFDKQLQAVDPDKAFLKAFFAKNIPFLLGIDVPYGHSELNPPRTVDSFNGVSSLKTVSKRQATEVRWGVRAPNPRVTFSLTSTGYLYDTFEGPTKFPIIIFGSDLKGPVRRRLAALDQYLSSPNSFVNKFGREQFTLVGITMQLPGDIDETLAADGDLEYLRKNVRWISDDHLPGSDAHTVYGVNHALGAVVVVRPDLWAGITVVPDEGAALDEYFSGFLLAQ
ncbi:hypothetical protein PLEOSDRAFT_1067151 [Pleurotus ostreatus PC15]|uniref:Uncharacterized protein n=1 Tax=Pleurotus ostreatus (strain PC15) TaxID=1137138 RepID=A0A067NJE4_PLEO1|nr:hypothetical protein PLEOSDRAFT_1067151 [Pleurotus ostreatus PC15]